MRRSARVLCTILLLVFLGVIVVGFSFGALDFVSGVLSCDFGHFVVVFYRCVFTF